MKVLALVAAATLAAARSTHDVNYVNLCAHDTSNSLCAAPKFHSFSGFINVSDKSSMFYWYFVPNDVKFTQQTPLLMWLQGGPGSSSMLGAFFEIGPMTLNSSAQLVVRSDVQYSWAAQMPVLFIDNPVGTGWSRVTDASAYATNENDVARDMEVFLKRFASKYTDAPKRLVIAGESYGGHYIPAIGAHIMMAGRTPFKLDGVAIGDGLTDPAAQVVTKPQAAFDFGLIDEKQLAEATSHAQSAHELALQGDYMDALQERNKMEDLVGKASAINLYDVRTTKDYSWMSERMKKFFSLDTVKDMLHVPREYTFDQTSDQVELHLNGDVMRSQKANVEALLKGNVRVLLYQGQFDWKDGASANEAWIRTMQWPGAAGYLNASRSVWRRSEDNEVAGYWRGYQNLEQVVVLGAGHLVPMNAASSAFDMISKFVNEDDHTATILV